MHALESVRRLRATTLFLTLSTIFVAAGGFVHLREWLDIYRHVPASTPGAAVVRFGFPINSAVSLVVVVALVLVLRRRSRLTQPVVLGALLFEAASLATLIGTRVGSVLGWSEPTWTRGANQTRAVEAAAIAALLALALVLRVRGTDGSSTTPAEHGLLRGDASPQPAATAG